jgi:hypothetical protein
MKEGDTVRVKTPGTPFSGWVGTIVRVERARSGPRVYYRLVFPGHPWQSADATWAFEAHELEGDTALDRWLKEQRR